MAFTDPNKPFVAKEVLTDNPPNKRIDLNGADAPNGIAFYTGDGAETFPGVIQPQSDANFLSVTASSPLVVGKTGASLELATGKGINQDSAQLGAESLLVSGSKNASMVGPVIGVTGINSAYYLNTDVNGQYADIIAPRIFLRDNSAGNNSNGLIAQGTGLDIIGNAWQGTTQIPLVNAWVDTAGARFGAMKDAVGNVHLRGLIRVGTAVSITTLPVGMRPSSNLDFTVQNKNGLGLTSIGVSTAGLIQISSNFVSGTMQVYFDGITFPTL